MGWLTNEMMFYGGVIIAGSSLVITVIYLIASHIQRIYIEMQLKKEYGISDIR